MVVDPRAPGGSINGRVDFRISGRIDATAPIEHIEMLHRQRLIGRLSLGRHGAAAGPDAGAASQAFRFILPLEPGAGPVETDFTVVARLRDGEAIRAVYLLRADPANALAGLVEVGPTEPAATARAAGAPMVLYVERATLDTDGLLTAHGWVIASSPVVTIQTYVGDARAGIATAGVPRPDVAAAHPAYPSAHCAGFTLAVPCPAAADRASGLRVQAIATDGTAQDVVLPLERIAAPAPPPPAVEPLPEPAGEPVGEPSGNPPGEPPGNPAGEPLGEAAGGSGSGIDLYCDELALSEDGILRITGWAVGPAPIEVVDVLLNETKVGEAERGQPRHDVGAAYPDRPSAGRSGFRLTLRIAEAIEGMHRIDVIARTAAGSARTFGGTVRAEGIAAEMAAPPTAAEPAAPPPAVSRHDPSAFKFQLDNPLVLDGAMTHQVTGRLTIEGWALARDGVLGIDVLLDGDRLGAAHYGLARHDVGGAFPDWAESLRSGYAFHCPPRSLSNGAHIVTLRVRPRHGETLEHSFAITVAKAADSEQHTAIRRRVGRAEADLHADVLARLNWQPRFVLRIGAPAQAGWTALADTLDSLQAQLYPHWRAALPAGDDGWRADIRALAAERGIDPARIAFADGDFADGDPGADGRDDDGHADAADLVGFLAAGDVLGCDALTEIAVQSGLHRDGALFYCDESRAPLPGAAREAFFKPAFSPELLLATNYIGHGWFATPALLRRAALAPGPRAAGIAYDLLLRCTEQAEAAAIHAVPRLLCERRLATAAEDAAEADDDRRALAAAAARRGMDADVLPGLLPGHYRLRRRAAATGTVSIIVPTRAAGDLVRTCLNTLRARTAYRDIEIVAIDNIPPELAETKAWLRENADTVVEIQEPFNWSRFNNRAVAAARGEYLLFLNDDIEVIEDDWLDTMLEQLDRPGVGIVGARLLYPDGTVQHAGMFLAAQGLARHAFRYAAADEPGYFGLARTPRNVMAVTGACLLTRRATFDRLGGFEEAHEIINNDLDFCLRVNEAGLRTVFTPYATLVHHELASRAALKDVYDTAQFDLRWGRRFALGDPFHNPNLTRQADDVRADDEPTCLVFGGHPVFRAADIHRILVVKVDHIGDFITALPAIRRLKAHFPRAHLSVLAGQAVRGFAGLEPAIDAFIPFDFFHVRSALGKRELEPDALDDLRARLAPHRFDLAIDLRKHLDTRELLLCAGAPITAGFDYMGQYNWLDVALEWEGDRGLHPKRYHVTDDLLHLVDAVATAAQADRTGIHPDAVTAMRDAATMPDGLAAFLEGPVICVHAGAGNEMKQWPEAHFAALIDLLLDRHPVGVLLIGGAEEADIATRVLDLVGPRDRVLSVVGRLGLRDLPSAIAGCALYVGNDSGPKHIAAALGVPTVGVHSGTVDPIEWAPMGPRAVAVARAMSCGPCYINQLSDCPRDLACLRQLEPRAVYRACEMLLAGTVPAA